MNKAVIFKKFWLVLCFGLIIFMQSAAVFARPGEHPQGPRRGPEEIVAGHETYRYHDGRFYRPLLFGLFEVIVDVPPAGAIVTVLPIGHRTIVVEGVTYYYYDNIYYTACPFGYVVVSTPVVRSNIASVSTTITQPQKISGERITINVPNSNGSYTPIVLVKQKDGYIGPQGEYYPGHPTIEQLEVLYGK